jgi:acetyl-CoA carboxylase alpha subunit
MALAGADRLLMTERSEFYVLPKAAVAALFNRRGSLAQVPEQPGTAAADLLAAGIIDAVLPDTDDALRTAIRRFVKDPPLPGARSRRWSGSGRPGGPALGERGPD